MDVLANKYKLREVLDLEMDAKDEPNVFTSKNPSRRKEILEKFKKAIAPYQR